MKKYVIITGGSNGIGFSLGENLIDKGYAVFNLDVVPPCKSTSAVFIECDVRNRSQIMLAKKVIAEYLVIESNYVLIALINNAGVNYLDWFDKISEVDFNKVMDTNVKGTFFATQTFLPQLCSNKSLVMNIISNAADKPMTCSSVYNASKGAVKILTREMARELTPKYGVKIIGISPNKILDTKMSEYVDNVVPGLRNWTPDKAQEYEIANIPCRENTPLKTFTDFLAHIITLESENKYMSGNIIEYGV